jgi:dTMP kinase
VHVIRRYLPDIERAYAEADVYVFPVTDQLGSIEVPLSVLEARASGVPVVCTRFGALPELFPPAGEMVYADPSGFSDAVDRALRASAEGRGDLLERFSARSFAAAVQSAYSAAATDGVARTLVLSGVDGAGKSTQIEKLTRAFESRGVRVETLWCRWDPLLAKPAVKLLGTVSRRTPKRTLARTKGAEAAPGRRREIRAKLLRNPAVALLWRVIMVLDYGVRLAPAVRKAQRRSDVVLLDRYWQDVMVDYSYGGALQDPPRLLRKLLPDPDGMVILDLPEDVALRRKTDTPDRAYLTERRRLYHEVAAKHGAIVVDAERPADEVFELVLAEADRALGRTVDPSESTSA